MSVKGCLSMLAIFIPLLIGVVVLASCSVGKRAVYPGHYYGVFEGGNEQSLKRYQTEFKRDGNVLTGWYIPGKNKHLLVYYGGNAENISGAASRYASLGYSMLLVNYRGYGGSTGVPSEKVLVADALHILDAMVSKTGCEMSEVVLVGQSLGSGVASQVAANRDVGKLVLIVPFDSLKAVADGLMPIVPLSWFIGDSYRSDLCAAKIKCPVSIIAAGQDEVIPVKHARNLVGIFREHRANDPESIVYKEFPDAGHNTIHLQPKAEEYINGQISGGR